MPVRGFLSPEELTSAPMARLTSLTRKATRMTMATVHLAPVGCGRSCRLMSDRKNRPVVVAKDVKKSFQHMGRTLDVLRGIDLVINEGEMVGIVGQSGAGKSTLLHCIGTLDIITSGSLKIDDTELTELSG